MTWTGRSVLSLIIVLLMGYMVVASFDYGFKARLFPASLGSLIFVMALLQFLADTFPAVRKKLPFLAAKGVSLEGSGAKGASVGSAPAGDQHRPEPSWPMVFGIVAALAAFAVLMSYTSFVVAVPVFLLLFVWLVAKERLVTALGLAIGILAFMYVIFRVILRSTF